MYSEFFGPIEWKNFEKIAFGRFEGRIFDVLARILLDSRTCCRADQSIASAMFEAGKFDFRYFLGRFSKEISI